MEAEAIGKECDSKTRFPSNDHSKVTSNSRVHQLMQLRTLNLSNHLQTNRASFFQDYTFKIRSSFTREQLCLKNYDIFVQKLKEQSKDI